MDVHFYLSIYLIVMVCPTNSLNFTPRPDVLAINLSQPISLFNNLVSKFICMYICFYLTQSLYIFTCLTFFGLISFCVSFDLILFAHFINKRLCTCFLSRFLCMRQIWHFIQCFCVIVSRAFPEVPPHFLCPLDWCLKGMHIPPGRCVNFTRDCWELST